MNSRERVLKALAHEDPDRVPFDLGSSLVTGITKNAYTRLAAALGEEIGDLDLYDTVQQLPLIGERIAQRLEVDIRAIVPNFVRKRPPVEKHGGVRSFRDEWGLKWTMPPGALYFDLADSPLTGSVGPRDIDNFPWPNPADPALFDGLEAQAQAYFSQGYAIMLESVCAGIFEMSCRMRGTEQFYMDLATTPAIAHALLEKFVDIKIRFYEAASERLGRYVHFVREGDDIAGQDAFLISPAMYREFLKPRHRALLEAQRKYFPPPFYTFFHSDGAVFDLVPDFIEIGVDILNPIQVSAKGMDIRRLKSEFGRDLSFWGGGADTQNLLPRATPEEVGRTVATAVRELAPDGGFIFGAIHNIQDDVPPENILAMLDAFRSVRGYAPVAQESSLSKEDR